MRRAMFFGLVLTLSYAGSVNAGDRAATQVLPGALTALGIPSAAVVSTADAHRVRGAGGCLPPPPPPSCPPTNCSPPPPQPPSCPPPPTCSTPPACQGGGGSSGQGTTIVISGGSASGQVVLMEGVVGQFQYTKNDPSGTTIVQGAFGGLAGYIGTDAGGNLNFSMAGKALQETVTFTGAQYNQVFTQFYRH